MRSPVLESGPPPHGRGPVCPPQEAILLLGDPGFRGVTGTGGTRILEHHVIILLRWGPGQAVGVHGGGLPGRSARGKTRGSSGVRFLSLKAISPIAWTPLGVSDGNDLDVVETLAKNNGERIACKNETLRSKQIARTKVRMTGDVIESGNQLFKKAVASLGALETIPAVR